MSFQYNASNVKPTSGGFAPLPKGKYLLQIEKATEKRSRNGDPMVVVDFKVMDARYSSRRIRFHHVTFLPEETAGAGIAIHFVKTIGEPHEGHLAVEPTRWLGKLLWGHVDQKPDGNGTLWNVVKDVEPYRDGPSAEHDAETPPEELSF